MENTTLRVAVFQNSEDYRSDCSVNEDASGITTYGYSFEILNTLQDILHFKTRFVTLNVSSSNQLLQSLTSDIADIVLCHPSVTSLPSVVFLFPTLRTSRALVYHGASLPTERDIFVRNTTGATWFYMCCVLALLAACLRLSTNQHHRVKPHHRDWTWTEVIQWVLAAICQQGTAREPLGCSCRTMFLIGYLVTYLLYTGFAAGITSLLAVRKEVKTLQLHDVMEQKLHFASIWDGSQDNFFENSAISSLVGNVNTKCPALNILLSKVERTHAVGMATEVSLVHYLATRIEEESRCELTLSTISSSAHNKAFAVQESSTYKHSFNYWLLRLYEHGILKRSANKFFKKLPECPPKSGFTEAGLDHVLSAFLIINIAFALSSIILIAEIIFYQNYRPFLDKKSKKNKMKSLKNTIVQQFIQ